MPSIPDHQLLRLLAELKAAYHGFAWESEIWVRHGHRRSPYRVLVLFGLSARTKDALLSEMCRRLFQRFPDAEALSETKEGAAGDTGGIVRAGQLPIVASMAKELKSGVPRDREGLLRINGVGDKIAECVLAYGWGEDALPLDANCVRVLDRVFGLGWGKKQPVPLREHLKCVYRKLYREFADLSISMVDVHEVLRLHGQVCCTRTPECARCPLSECKSRRMPRDVEKSVEVSAGMWEDWRELINEPAAV